MEKVGTTRIKINFLWMGRSIPKDQLRVEQEETLKAILENGPVTYEGPNLAPEEGVEPYDIHCPALGIPGLNFHKKYCNNRKKSGDRFKYECKVCYMRSLNPYRRRT